MSPCSKNDVLSHLLLSDHKLLGPFLDEVKRSNIECINQIHASSSCRTYYVKLKNSGTIGESRIALKVYQKEQDHGSQEIENLRLVLRISEEVPDYDINIPAVVWSQPSNAIWATKWIPGQNLDTAFRTASRSWLNRRSGQDVRDVGKLVNWLMRFWQTDHYEFADNAKAQDFQTWERWLSWLRGAEHFADDWRMRMAKELERNIDRFEQVCPHPGPYHGDFAPWNVRRGRNGQLWIMDWRRLEYGHWLEAAYRFYYALRLSALSPLAKPGYFKRLYLEVESFVRETVPESFAHIYYRVRALLRNLFFMCQRQPKSVKRRIIQWFWMRELESVTGRWHG